MAGYKPSLIARLVYSLVGAVGVIALIWAIINFSIFLTMGLFGILGFSIATIGSINWLFVAISGDRRMDLFGLIEEFLK
ncbi:MAG: hypothetical protein ACE5RP_00230 [Nitrosopumilus sp.]